MSLYRRACWRCLYLFESGLIESFERFEARLAPHLILRSIELMNEEDLSPAFRSWPLIISLVATLTALGSLLYAYKASQQCVQLNDIYQAQLEKSQSAHRLMAQYHERLSELEQGRQQNKQAIDRVRLYSSQQQKAMQQLVGGVEANRDQMVGLIKQLNLGTAQESSVTGQSEVEASQSALNPEPSPSISESSPRVHRIESGDNFARIAKAYNVGLQSLLDANPRVDPRRLQIGQEVLLPTN